MKKNLLGIILLLLFVGVGNGYGQSTATVTYSQTNFCEDERNADGTYKVKVTLELTGSGNYNYKYEFDAFGTGIPQSSPDIPVTGDPNGVTTIDLPLSFKTSGYFKLIYVNDNGTPIEPIENTYQDIVIDVLPTPVIDKQYKTCRKEVTLTAAPGEKYNSTNWYHTGGGTFLSKTDTEASFDADAVGNYTFTYEVTNGACIASDEYTLTINDVAMPSATFQFVKDRICSDENGVLQVNSNPNNRYDLTLHYTDGTNQYSEAITSANQTIELAPSETTTYSMLKLVDRQGCDAPLTDELVLSVDQKPNPLIVFIDKAKCGFDTTLTVQSINSNNLFEWSLVSAVGSGINFNDINSATTKVRVQESKQWAYESYDLRFREYILDNPTCLGASFVTVEFNKMPTNVSLGNDTTVYLDKALEFESTGLVDMPLEWSLPVGVDVNDLNVPKVTVDNLSRGDNKIMCTIQNGVCPAVVAEKLIRVNDIYQTTGFSPNGDNTNETFIIGGAKNVENNKLVVFDVTGKVVYEANNFMIDDDTVDGWDGYQNNGELKDGTYYYIFTGDGIDPIKNYLIIKGSAK
jgi:gliding motility-associated-like protein